MIVEAQGSVQDYLENKSNVIMLIFDAQLLKVM